MDIQTEPVTVTPIENGFRVAVRGPVHVNVAWLEGELRRVAEAKPKLVELDLAGTSYVSSAGMGVFLASRRAIAEGGGVLRIVAIQKPVLGSMQYAGLDGVFKIDPAAVVPAAAK
jgi:anti-anti-sigma factor